MNKTFYHFRDTWVKQYILCNRHIIFSWLYFICVSYHFLEYLHDTELVDNVMEVAWKPVGNPSPFCKQTVSSSLMTYMFMTLRPTAMIDLGKSLGQGGCLELIFFFLKTFPLSQATKTWIFRNKHTYQIGSNLTLSNGCMLTWTRSHKRLPNTTEAVLTKTHNLYLEWKE